jgi:hypothetical protein
MLSKPGMVAWCLDHGASVIRSDRNWERHGVVEGPRRCDQILDSAAVQGDIISFELLRLIGAPVGQQTLHRAVMSRFETLLPHGQPRLTFGEMRLPIPH